MATGFTRQTFSLPPPMLADLKREAEERGMTLSEILRSYLRNGGLGKQQDGLDLQRAEGSNDDGR